MRNALLLLLAAGCKPEEEQGISGSIEVDGLTGEVAVARAFAVTDEHGRFAAYLSSDPAADCAGVAEWLGSGTTADPADVLEGGTCNLYIPVPSYDGSFEAEDDAAIAAGVNIECFLGEGEFARGDDGGYAWTGRRWQGYPDAYRFAFATDGDTHDLDIEISTFEGYFPDEGVLDPAPATGEVKGAIAAEDCPALGEALGW